MTGVVSFVGAGTINATPNTGRLTIALKPVRPARPGAGGDRPAGSARSPAFRGSRRSSSRCRTSQIGTRVSRTAVPVHADGHRRGRAGALGAAAARRDGSVRRRWPTSRPTSRTRASAPSSPSTATRRCGWACRCRRWRTRCTTRSASGRSPPSSARPTSTAWCWRPTRPGRRTPTRCGLLRVPRQPNDVARCRCRRSPRSSADRRAAGRHAPGAVPRRSTLSFNLAPGYSLGDAVEAVAAGDRGRSACRRRSSAAIPATRRSSSVRWPPSRG